MFSRSFVSELLEHSKIFENMQSEEAKVLHAGFNAWKQAKVSDADQARLAEITKQVEYFTGLLDNAQFVKALQAKGADMGRLVSDRDRAQSEIDKLQDESAQLSDIQYAAFAEAYREALPKGHASHTITLIGGKVCQIAMSGKHFVVSPNMQDPTIWHVYAMDNGKIKHVLASKDMAKTIAVKTPTMARKVVYALVNHADRVKEMSQADIASYAAGGTMGTAMLEVSAATFMDKIKANSDKIDWLK